MCRLTENSTVSDVLSSCVLLIGALCCFGFQKDAHVERVQGDSVCYFIGRVSEEILPDRASYYILTRACVRSRQLLA